MSKREKRLRKTLEKQEKARAKSEGLQRLSPEVAKSQLIIFGFKHLDLNKGKFQIGNNHGPQLLNIIRDLIKHCGYDIITIGSRAQFHSITQDQLKKHNLEHLATLARSKVFQMGSSSQPERIVGFFEPFTLNV